MIYRQDRSSVKTPFELSQALPGTITIYEQIDLEWVRERIRENPLVTLRSLSQLIKQQFGVAPSISHVLRLQQLAGISRIPCSRAKTVAEPQTFVGISEIAA